ncbi:hypothetical protein D3C79_1107720 [compost metagenome]
MEDRSDVDREVRSIVSGVEPLREHPIDGPFPAAAVTSMKRGYVDGFFGRRQCR